MPVINRLTAIKIKSLSKPGLHADGGGLYLRILDGGNKSWIFRYTRHKKAHQMGLGPLRDSTLAEARAEAEQCRKWLKAGIDPITHRKTGRAKQAASEAKALTFKECAVAYIKAHSDKWNNAKHINQWENTLSTYVYPEFGALPVDAIDLSLVLKVLEPIWKTKTETASRLRARIERILDWAEVRGCREGSNPARWKGWLETQLPAPSEIQKVVHHEALPYEDMGTFMKALREKKTVSARSLEFTILTAARTEEVIAATWFEMDIDKGVWTRPWDRMKGKKEHRIPLSAEALAILEEMKAVSTSDYVFPGREPKRPQSNMTMLQLAKRLWSKNLTVHGFRSTFRDWTAERTGYAREVAEMALAHTIENKVEAAYRRGDLFEKRRRMMRDWADYCSMSAGGGVVPLQNNGTK